MMDGTSGFTKKRHEKNKFVFYKFAYVGLFCELCKKLV